MQGQTFSVILTDILYIYRVNIGCGPVEERVLLTGLHAGADTFCGFIYRVNIGCGLAEERVVTHRVTCSGRHFLWY